MYLWVELLLRSCMAVAAGISLVTVGGVAPLIIQLHIGTGRRPAGEEGGAWLSTNLLQIKYNIVGGAIWTPNSWHCTPARCHPSCSVIVGIAENRTPHSFTSKSKTTSYVNVRLSESTNPGLSEQP